MGKKIRSVFGKFRKDEKGQALILVLLLLLLGSIIITPLLSYMSTGLRTGQMYQRKTDELYAADAGVEDSIWQIKYNHLNTLFPTYDVYDYTSIWTYNLSEQVNEYNPDVTIENVWVPKDLPVPTQAQARAIITAGKLIVTGSVTAASTYQIKIYYYKGDADDPLMIETLGVWLPAGFTYIEGSSNLDDDDADYYSVPVVTPHAGGQAIVWEFSSYPFAGSDSPEITPFPGVNPLDNPMTSTITFQFNSTQPERNPKAVSWITTSGVSDIPFSWDADTKVYRITSTAGDTQVEAYTAKSEIRELGSAIAGDYCAIGNSLMIDQYSDWGGPRRDTLLTESSATVDDIPLDAEVAAAYLYWSAWLAGGSDEEIIWEDNCRDFSDWNNPANDWVISGNRFRGHHIGSAPDWHRYLTLQDSLDLSSYQGETVMVSWDQSESGRMEDTDGLDFAFSADGGSSWSDNIEAFRDDNPLSSFSYVIPDTYLTENFKMRFYLVDCSNEYVYIDNIRISAFTETIADTTAIFKIDGQQVYFDTDDTPQQGAQEINATEWSVLENKPGTYSYSCYLDVTELVKAFSSEGTYGNHPGNATYTVGGVDADTGDEWSYAGWSLIIIYSSSETKGHQLYLYDTFIYSAVDQNVDFDGDGNPGGTISGFLVPEQVADEIEAAKLTVFVGEGDDYYDWDYLKFNEVALSDGKTTSDVWNSWSLEMSEDGVDIDTFHVTWASGLLEPGDTSAQIDLPTKTDSWNLVYIILSFRSESTTGGAISYLIRG
jgi:hypothetical protein